MRGRGPGGVGLGGAELLLKTRRGQGWGEWPGRGLVKFLPTLRAVIAP